MRTIALVPCVGKKLDHAAPARELYCSEWFIKARRLAESRFNYWFILSAKHHLVMPQQVIEPYEMTLNTMNRCDRLIWSTEVLRQLHNVLRRGDLVTILAGRRYREFLVPQLIMDGFNISLPLDGMGIGQQLAWMKDQSPIPRGVGE